ncbi:13274_t:CDS:2 [Acaulospora colombiana]|uniref:13274_t:CDS:1 n=1 Tax=Acaulospora colombiana TaxID=27376 RepID=A0ACA9KPC4_9GLOM|nr:13274_t:CDS:2 [Acaulospora colombiana]
MEKVKKGHFIMKKRWARGRRAFEKIKVMSQKKVNLLGWKRHNPRSLITDSRVEDHQSEQFIRKNNAGNM